VKKNNEYFTYYYVDRPYFLFKIDNILNPGNWNVRLFKFKDISVGYHISKDFKIN
jgi:hypothetical protein